MAQELSQFAEGSPEAHQISDLEEQDSFLSVYQQVSSHVHKKFSDKFERDVLDYCVEWELVVTTRVDAELATVKVMRDNYNHYQAKVDGLRRKVNGQESKGKSVKEDLAEKLKRNEDKLDEASGEFEAAATPLCCLIEEVVDCAWKDLVPLLQNLVLWEADRSHKEAKLFQQLRNLKFLGENGSGSSKKAKAPTRSSPHKKRSPDKKVGQFKPDQLNAMTPKVVTPSAADDDGIRVGPAEDEDEAQDDKTLPRRVDSV